MKKLFTKEFAEEQKRKEDEGNQILLEQELKFREWKLLDSSNVLGQLFEKDLKEAEK